MDNYRILAEHFGRNGKVRVIVTGTEAKTDGTTIYLPENVPDAIQGVLLATLMHESYHIRLTSFDVAAAINKGSEHRAHILNVLEDVRIDTLVHADWPNASNLYWDLMDYYMQKHGAEFNKLPWQVRVCRNFIIKSYNRQSFARHLHRDAEVHEFETANAAKLASICNQAKAAPDTKTLGPLVDELLALLFPADEKAEQDRQDNVKRIREQGTGVRAARDAQKDAQGKAKAIHDQAVKDENEAHEAEREEVRERAQAKGKRDAAKEAKAKGKAKEAEDMDDEADELDEKADAAKEKAGKAKARRADAQKKLDELGKEFQDQKKAGDKAQKDVDDANAALQAARAANAEREAKGLTGLDGIGIGFDKVRGEDLVVKEIMPENVEEEVREFLRAREERKVHAPEGRIDPARLPTYFNPETLFARDMNDATYKTRIHFLVDISGSMGSPLSGDLGNGETRIRKSEAATQAVLDVARAVEQGINCDGLDVEFGIFGFDEAAHEVKGFEAAMDEKAIRAGLAPRGGTDPLEVLRNVEEKHRPDCIRTKQIVFFITDGQFGGDAYDYLERETSGHIQWVFLGVDVSDDDSRAHDLFGKFNISKAGDLKRALGKALVERMEVA